MPSKQLIAYTAPGDTRCGGGGADTAHGHQHRRRAAVPGHAEMPPSPWKTLTLVSGFFLESAQSEAMAGPGCLLGFFSQ